MDERKVANYAGMGCLTLIGFCVVLAMIESGTHKTQEPPAKEGETVAITLESDSVVLPCGSSEEALSEMNKWVERGDNQEFHRAAIETGSTLLENGQRVKVLDRGILKSKVRVQSTGAECWVVTDALRHKAVLPGESTASNPPTASHDPQPSAIPPTPSGSSPAQTIIGKWLDEKLMRGGVIISIYRESGKLYRQMDCKIDGSSTKDEVVEMRSPLGRRFQAKEPSDYGDYVVIDRKGSLQLWDRQGFIETAGRIE